MGDLQIHKQSKKYDAVIVGSGAGGEWPPMCWPMRV